MGNKKFKLSNMIPNAWFYKLRDMGKNNAYRNKKPPQPTSLSSSSLSNSSSLLSSSVSTNSTSVPPKTKHPQISHHRKSYYFTREWETKFPNSPIKSPEHIIGNGVNREACDKPVSSVSIVSDSGNSFLTTNYASLDSKFDGSGRLEENKSPCSPISSPKKIINRARSEKRISPIALSFDSTTSSSNTNLESFKANLDGFDPIYESKLPNSPIGSPKLRIKNRVLRDIPNSQVPVSSDSANDIFDTNSENIDTTPGGFYPIFETKLPPIITKKGTEEKQEKKIGAPRKQRSTPVSRHSVYSGVRLRSNSPRIAKIDESERKSFSSGGRRRQPESFAVVKSSSNPQKDFRESMVEMILHNEIKGSKELENLLACYLVLNCDEYHEMIIKVFKQIWFELYNISV